MKDCPKSDFDQNFFWQNQLQKKRKTVLATVIVNNLAGANKYCKELKF